MNQPTLDEAKAALDTVIRKARVHFYKPIQIAEILYHQRTGAHFSLSILDNYRTQSRGWRDSITQRLVGNVSTSSMRYQDDVFNDNAMPPRMLAVLGRKNVAEPMVVEAYIYHRLKEKLGTLLSMIDYVHHSTPDNFNLLSLFSRFTNSPGLVRSLDKVYESAAYALFTTIVNALNVEVTLKINNTDAPLLRDFDAFIRKVLGLTPDNPRRSFPAQLHRAGVTNAADTGLDMWGNFGAAVQVKHISLSSDLIDGIASENGTAKVIIICLQPERGTIESVLRQAGLADRVQAIITLDELAEWYQICFQPQHRSTLGRRLLDDLYAELTREFPSNDQIDPFMQERGYADVTMPTGWGAADGG